jgi:hypothetical protein
MPPLLCFGRCHMRRSKTTTTPQGSSPTHWTTSPFTGVPLHCCHAAVGALPRSTFLLSPSRSSFDVVVRSREYPGHACLPRAAATPHRQPLPPHHAIAIGKPPPSTALSVRWELVCNTLPGECTEGQGALW